MKGSLIDIAVGFVMGAAFTKLVTAFTEGMVAPLISMLTEKVNFQDMKWVLREGVTDAAGLVTTAEVAVKWGSFITATIDFVIVAFVMFMVIKSINRMKKAEPAPAPAGPSSTDKLLMEIRDSLKK